MESYGPSKRRKMRGTHSETRLMSSVFLVRQVFRQPDTKWEGHVAKHVHMRKLWTFEKLENRGAPFKDATRPVFGWRNTCRTRVTCGVFRKTRGIGHDASSRRHNVSPHFSVAINSLKVHSLYGFVKRAMNNYAMSCNLWKYVLTLVNRNWD